MKPDCYKCEYKRSIPGDAHISCGHPVFEHPTFGAQLKFVSMLLVQQRGGIEPIAVKGNAHGIANGWFGWPVNFDSVWLESCGLFKELKCPTTSPQKSNGNTQQSNVESDATASPSCANAKTEVSNGGN